MLQYNKRDLAEQGIPLQLVESMETDLNSQLKVPSFEASALKGTNVLAALKKVIILTISTVEDQLR